MRAWYHNKDGKQANLCKMLYGESTRLIVIQDGKRLDYTIYPTWADALTALKKQGTGWISDLTGLPLQ